MNRFFLLSGALQLQPGGSVTEPPVLLSAAILLVALGALAVILYRRIQSRRALVRRLAELSALADVGRAISGAPPDLRQLAELVYRQAGQIVNVSSFQLGLFEADRYRLLIWIVDGERRPPAVFRLTSDSLGIVGWLRESRRSLLVRDFQAEHATLPATPRYASPDPPRSGVFVPLLVGDQALGAMAVQSRQPNAFSEEGLRLLTIVAGHAAAALEKARLLEQAERRAQQLQELSEVTQQVNVLQPLPDLYRQVVALASEKFGAFAVSYFECEGARLALRATTRADWVGLSLVLDFGESLAGAAALSHELVVSQDFPDYPRGTVEYATAGKLPELAVPVQIDGRVLGVLHALSRDGAAFDESIVALFKSLAAQLAIAILEGQTYQAEQRRADQLAAIAQASRAITSNLELEDLLDEVLDLVDERFGYKRARIFLARDNRLVFRAGVGGRAARLAEHLAYALNGPGLIALAGRTGQPILVNDVAADPNYTPGPGLEDSAAELAVPMMFGARLLGVFDVQSTQRGAFGDEDVQTVQTLADTLSVALRNARLFESERRRRRLAETLREVSAAVTSTLQLDDVLDLILTGLARVVSYDSASILLANDAKELVLRASAGAPGLAAAVGHALDVKLLEAGETLPATVPFGQVDHQSQYHHLLNLPEPHACLGAVLALGGEHLGYLVVDRAGQPRFSRGETELIAAFAAQAAVAIENARLYTAQREQAWVSTALLQVAEATARATELQEVMETVARLTPMLVGVDRCGILLLGPAGAFGMAAYHGAEETAAPAALPGEVTPDHWPKLAEMLASREPVVLEVDDFVPDEWRALFPDIVILLPLLTKGRVAGAMLIGQSPGEAPFTAHRIRLLGGIANQAALAIESATLYAAQQEEAWVSTALLQVAQSIAEEPTLEAAMQTVARLTPMLVGVERLAIYRWDAPAAAFFPAQLVGFEPEIEIELGHTLLVPDELGIDLQSDNTAMARLPLPERLASAFGRALALVWPLRARGNLLGALVVEHVAAADRRLNILNGIAHQLALAMENARLTHEVALRERLEREIEVGRDIQASFLPEACPQFPGWEVCAFWRSARQVGGDFYDFIPLRAQAEGAERWGIVIADVSDKGVPAALYMALSRTLLRSVAIGRGAPASTLARVNDIILSDARSEQFVTVFFAVWEPSTGRLSYANAGHNPPALVRQDGKMQLLSDHGIALGVIEGAEYKDHVVQMQPGDALFLYTDGVTDAINGEEAEFGLERVLRIVEEQRACSAAEMQAAVASAIQAHAGTLEAFDDITMVVLKRARA